MYSTNETEKHINESADEFKRIEKSIKRLVSLYLRTSNKNEYKLHSFDCEKPDELHFCWDDIVDIKTSKRIKEISTLNSSSKKVITIDGSPEGLYILPEALSLEVFV
jgi:archaellum component FlaC